jgi:hypothetical protein
MGCASYVEDRREDSKLNLDPDITCTLMFLDRTPCLSRSLKYKLEEILYMLDWNKCKKKVNKHRHHRKKRSS